MTRKHFERLAEILRRTRPIPYSPEDEAIGISEQRRVGQQIQHALIVSDIMDYLASENPRFDRQRFLHAITDSTPVVQAE